MSWEKSETMKEFEKIMSESGLFKTAEKNPHQEDEKTIKEKRLPKGKDIIEQAHPKPVYVAESQGDGALVENQNEQHEKLMEIINRMPTGIVMHRYASSIDALIKMADVCDSIGELEASDVLIDTAEKLVEMMDSIPFVEAPTK